MTPPDSKAYATNAWVIVMVEYFILLEVEQLVFVHFVEGLYFP